jgi:uncharacterized protein YbaA (DUF1428 family)
MADYVDGFVVPVPKKNLAAYRRMAQKSAKVWREYGVMQDPRLTKMMKSMPFDGKRMFWGGFKPIVSL